MKNAAIIAEFNPFHNGHKYIVETARKNGAECIVAVMSGNYVQRGNVALFDKFSRTKAALLNGIDFVAELPTVMSLSSASGFANGAAHIIKELNCDTLVFGSECGNLEDLITVCKCLSDSKTDALIVSYLKSGITYASAREKAVNDICGLGEILKNPNDTLAVEYILAFKNIGYYINFFPVKRIGALHDSTEISEGITSASNIRKMYLSNENIDDLIPNNLINLYSERYHNGHYADIKFAEKAILDRLRRMTAEQFSMLPDIGSEGLDNRIINAVKQNSTLEKIAFGIKTKRYTLARIYRIIMYAYLGITKEDVLHDIQYIRILGCNNIGLNYINSIRKTASIPLIMRTTDIKNNEMFIKECGYTDLYGIFCKNTQPCGQEFSQGIIRHS